MCSLIMSSNEIPPVGISELIFDGGSELSWISAGRSVNWIVELSDRINARNRQFTSYLMCPGQV